MKQEQDNKLNSILYQIINLPNFEKTAKRYYEKWQRLDEYTGVKSIRTDREIAGGSGKTYNDIIMEKDQAYLDYLFYKHKRDEVYNMLAILDKHEREIILDWYTTPRNYRKLADEFAKDHNMSRADFFRKKKEALNKLLHYCV